VAKQNIWGEEEEEKSNITTDKKTHHSYDPANFEYFGENKIALCMEVPHHPILTELLAKHAPDEFEIKLAEIACYCEVILNDAYTPEDIEHLCGVLLHKLRTKRGAITFIQG